MYVRTARGWHLWFASSGLPTRAGVIEGVDVRGKGGYVVAPPSVHPTGATYRLVDPANGKVLDRLPSGSLTPAPAWLVSWCRPEPARRFVDREPVRLTSEHYARAAVQSECAAVAATGEGNRNERLNGPPSRSEHSSGPGCSKIDEARAHLLDAALSAGLGEVEALRTIGSGLRAGESRPRQLTGAPRRADRPPQPSPRRLPEHSVPGESRGDADDNVTAGVLARARHDVPPRPAIARPTAARPRRELGRSSALGGSNIERPDRLAETHERLVEAVEGLVKGDDWAAMLAVAGRFHSYSLNNVLLISLQCAERGIEPTRVAGYRAWQALGHQVRRGERGLAVLAPVVRRTPEERDEPFDGTALRNGGEHNPVVRRVLAGFKVATVFDISQTEGPPLPEVAPELLSGDAPVALYEGLAKQVAEAGFSLVREDCSPANGRTDFARRSVSVRDDLEPAQAAKTLAHELGHVLLHDDPKFLELGAFSCRGLAEVEAESVAYLVCATAGLPTGGYSFPYVARWANGDVSLVRSAGERSLGTARVISRALGLVPAPNDTATEDVLAHSRSGERNPVPAKVSGSSVSPLPRPPEHRPIRTATR